MSPPPPRSVSVNGRTYRWPDRPLVVGELYFEYHRGVYTSQARTKRGNRRGEARKYDLFAQKADAH